MERLIIGTRGSKLARAQTELVAGMLAAEYPDLKIKIKIITTTGDRKLNKHIAEVTGKGLFIKELEQALLTEEIDLAVHSLKDIPPGVDRPFRLACFPLRANPADVFVSNKYSSLAELPAGAVLGTGSARRQAQVGRLYPELRFTSIRGNVDSRLEKMAIENLDGLILAAAGLIRLGLEERIAEYLPLGSCIPAAGQGTLALETLYERENLLKLLSPLNNSRLTLISTAERAYLGAMGGSCRLPLGARARFRGEELVINGFWAVPEKDIYVIQSCSREITINKKPGKIKMEKQKQITVADGEDGLTDAKKLARELGKKLAVKIKNEAGKQQKS